ncbi:MAG: DUF4214 domain-containing protein [Candidatus Riflebacteria bacterium]|nr:DUF4214 domain-containing protein [Candidatus Riflebacteria bacterium]
MKQHILIGMFLIFSFVSQNVRGEDPFKTLEEHDVDINDNISGNNDSSQCHIQDIANQFRINYIRSLYKEILGREPDPHGLDTWLTGLQTGAHTLESVRDGILNSHEKMIGDWYRELLGRNPDREGIETWLEAIRAGEHSLESVRQAIIDSEEYRGQSNGSTVSTASTNSGESPVKVAGDGSSQQSIVKAAQTLVNQYSSSGSFPYAPATQGGLLGCAQVATTALKNAGIQIDIDLAVLSTIPKLKELGWSEVTVPPYQGGDVITWATYDTSGDGCDDPDTHIGIIMQNGNSVQAMSNDSYARRPSIHSATAFPVSRVLRKV